MKKEPDFSENEIMNQSQIHSLLDFINQMKENVEKFEKNLFQGELTTIKQAV